MKCPKSGVFRNNHLVEYLLEENDPRNRRSSKNHTGHVWFFFFSKFFLGLDHTQNEANIMYSTFSMLLHPSHTPISVFQV